MKNSSIELLESRIAPAAIALALTGSNLKITFSSHDSIAIIPDSAGGIDVFGTPGDTFTLNGSPLSTIPSTPGVSLSSHHIGSISITDSNTADQNDSINLFAAIQGNVAISLAGTANSIMVNSPLIHGGLSVKTPAGGTQVVFDAPSQPQLIGGAVKLALGNGNNTVTVESPQFEVNGAFLDSGGPTKGSITTADSNVFTASLGASSGYFRVAGEFLFNSPLASANFEISAQTVQIGGKLIVNEGQASATNRTDGIQSLVTTVGGNVLVHTDGVQPWTLSSSGFLNVGGSLTVVEAAAGNVTIIAGQSMTMSGLSLSGQSGATLQLTDVNFNAGAAVASIGGNVKINGFGTDEITLFGSVGGSFAISGAQTLYLDPSTTGPATTHLAIGGSLSIVAPVAQTILPAVAPVGAPPALTATIGDLLVGGSFNLTGNSSGTSLTLADSSIVGNMTLNLGAKVNGPGQSVTILETSGDHAMFIGGALNANLGAGGNLTVADQNSIPDILVYGQATFNIPTINTLTLTTPSTLFALPIKVKMSS